MNISKADVVAHLGKWRDANTPVQSNYTTAAGNVSLVGTIAELSQTMVKIIGAACQIVLYFQTTTEYDYKDARETLTEANKNRINKYPTVINIKFSGGGRLEVSEAFDE